MEVRDLDMQVQDFGNLNDVPFLSIGFVKPDCYFAFPIRDVLMVEFRRGGSEPPPDR
jgi:hypothetical protein